ncbi:uncharacterized protein BDZ99DRAFT_485973 [Mytilinidion resinicola]|uniref:RING-type E3 ubiquitin transferase n=1 Tax=Mytilinidion resinicola TaxID=574789 RepID=A0A6A6YZL4_9PEZI|nr:uncharacterized protein BDZ99DRAFT_485973 [Mytilinidion resinicola]KAF2813883.1 hypothetical protein BDZ99DRAFT_485973 [Mytilinidion resinicola]
MAGRCLASLASIQELQSATKYYRELAVVVTSGGVAAEDQTEVADEVDVQFATLEALPAASRTEDNSETCVICLSAISERAITVPCNHYSFDFICLVSWLQERSACPLFQYEFYSPTDYKTYTIQSTRTPNPHGAATPLPHNPQSRSHPTRPFRRRQYTPPNPDTALLKRRHVYKHSLYSLHVGSNRISRYQNLTPALISSSPDLQSRARTWIRRELRVFPYLNPAPEPHEPPASTSSSSTSTTPSARRASNAEFLLSYILAILKAIDLKAPSGQAEDMLAEFLGRPHARLFLHELGAWLRSPYTRLEDWDRNVQYAERLPERGADRRGERRGRRGGSGRP